jgi:predicted acyltransferase
VFAGLLLKDDRLTPQQKSLSLIVGGIVLIAAGLLWSLQFPIIKAIWTSSFVLVTGGASAILLGIAYQIIDVWGQKGWATIFVWVGANAIMLYLLNGLMGFETFAARFVGGDVAAFLDGDVTAGAGLFSAYALGLVFAVALAGFFYRRKIFLRV